MRASASANSRIATCATDETPHPAQIESVGAEPRGTAPMVRASRNFPTILLSRPGSTPNIPAAAEFTPTARREFLKLMGASFALAGLTGCEKSPFVAALPYVDQPQDAIRRSAAILRDCGHCSMATPSR